MRFPGVVLLTLFFTLIAGTSAQDQTNTHPVRQGSAASTKQLKPPLEYRGLRLGMDRDAASELLRAINTPFIEQENARRAHDVELCVADKEDKATDANYLLGVRKSALKEYDDLLRADPVLPTEMQIQRMKRMTNAELIGGDALLRERAIQSQEAQLFKFTGIQSWSEFKQKYGDTLNTPEKLPDGVRLYIAVLLDHNDSGGPNLSAAIGDLVDARIKHAQADLYAAKEHACELATALRTPQCGDPECEGSVAGVVAGMNKGHVSSIRQDNLEDVASYVAAFSKKYGKPQTERHNRYGLGGSWIWESGNDRLEVKDVCGQNGSVGTAKGCLVLSPKGKAGPEI